MEFVPDAVPPSSMARGIRFALEYIREGGVFQYAGPPLDKKRFPAYNNTHWIRRLRHCRLDIRMKAMIQVF